jgi:hypothetical protein
MVDLVVIVLLTDKMIILEKHGNPNVVRLVQNDILWLKYM